MEIVLKLSIKDDKFINYLITLSNSIRYDDIFYIKIIQYLKKL